MTDSAEQEVRGRTAGPWGRGHGMGAHQRGVGSEPIRAGHLSALTLAPVLKPSGHAEARSLPRGKRRGGRTNAGNTHCTARAEPFTVWYFRQRRVQTVQVIGRRAGVTAQQLPAILTHTAKLHVVILLLFASFLVLLLLFLRLPLDPFLLLGKVHQHSAEYLLRWPIQCPRGV